MNSVGVFVDISNLYRCIHKKHPEKKLGYDKYLKLATPEDSVTYRAIAYGVQSKDEANKFITCLKYFGFDVKYRRQKNISKYSSWSVGISLDIVRIVHNNKLDVVVIGSSSPDFVDLIVWVKERGVKCIVVSCGIPKELKEVADSWVEIPDDCLETT